jgi:hypothetical protein
MVHRDKNTTAAALPEREYEMKISHAKLTPHYCSTLRGSNVRRLRGCVRRTVDAGRSEVNPKAVIVRLRTTMSRVQIRGGNGMKEATKRATSEALAHMLAVTALLVIASVLFYSH